MVRKVQRGGTARFAYAAASWVGSLRQDNEDAWGISEDRSLFVVADGCGGRGSGRSAADISVACVLRETPHFDGLRSPPADTVGLRESGAPE